MTNETATRNQMIEDGDLMDYTDIARAIGYQWGVAMTADLEDRLLATLPNLKGAAAIEAGMGAAVHEVLASGHEALVEATSPDAKSASSLIMLVQPSWKEGETIKVRVSIGPDDDGKPCFTFDAAE